MSTPHRPECGTQAGSNLHYRFGEQKCEDCKDWHRRYMRERRTKRAMKVPVTYPLETGSAPCDGLGVAIAQAIRESA